MHEYRDLIDQACQARLNSYSPYSGFRVGAALLGKSGRVYLDTNVENASFGLSNCAERTAVFRAVADGETEFEAIAVCADGAEPTPPCGACRQVLPFRSLQPWGSLRFWVDRSPLGLPESTTASG